MTGSDITPGARVGNWQVLGVDGRRAHAICVCGTVRVLAIASLLDGSAAPSCGCQQLSRQQIDAQWDEAERRRRELKSWRPQA